MEKKKGYCHGCTWRSFDASILRYGKRLLFLEAEWEARDGNFICTHFFIQTSEKLPTHLDWALPWQQGGGFA